MTDPSMARFSRPQSAAQPPGWTWDPVAGASRLQPEPLRPDWHDARTHQPIRPAPVGSRQAAASPPQPPTEAEQTLRMAAIRLCQVLVETLTGQRRLIQLENWFEPESLAVVAEGLARWQGSALRLASVHVQLVGHSSAEVALRLASDRLDHAAALRISRASTGWMVSGLVIG